MAAVKKGSTKSERARARRERTVSPAATSTSDDETTAPKRERPKLARVDAPNPGVGRVPSPHRSVAEPVPRNDLATPVVTRPETAAQRKSRLRKVKPTRVVAIARGYYNERLYEIGQKFDMVIDPDLDPPRWVALLKKKKDEQTPEEEFGPEEDDTKDEDDRTDDESDEDDEDDDADDEGEEEDEDEI